MPTAIFFSLPLHGHVNPSIAVVTELVARGERIFYYCTEEFRPLIEQTGAIFRCYEDIDLTSKPMSNNSMQVVCAISNLTYSLLERCLSAAREIQPDYIMHDTFAYWGNFIAQIIGVPAIGSQASLILTAQSAITLPRYLLQTQRHINAIRSTLNTANTRLKLLANTYHITVPTLPEALFSYGDRTLVYTYREFQPRYRILDKRFIFIGPSVTARKTAAAFPFEKLTGKPIIYISLGTIFNDRPDFYRSCLQAFAERDIQVIMAIGTYIQVEDLGPIPENFIVQQRVPQLEILPRSTLFLTHGGLNSVMEALYYNVPMLVFPSEGGDQLGIGMRVQQIGAGKIFQHKNITPQHIYQAAQKILAQPKFAQASTRAGAALHATGGVTHGCDEIKRFLATCSSSQSSQGRGLTFIRPDQR